MRVKIPGVIVDSAGTGGWHVGDAPYGPAIEAAQARGYDLSGQRARQVSGADFDRFDLILAMDRQNLADLRALAPAEPRAKLHLFLEPIGGGDVPDPYYTRDFNGTLDLIERAADGWAERLR